MKRAESGGWKVSRLPGPAVVLMLLLMVWATPASVRARQVTQQQPPVMPGQPMSQPNPMDTGVDPAISARMQEQRRRSLEDDRHRRIAADASKLLQLATELKTEVDKSTKNELSIAVIDKAAEIEKLSHDMKERMKN
jgi:hypothetical protein